MPATPYVEAHFEASNTVWDMVMGMSGGLASAAAFGLARWIS